MAEGAAGVSHRWVNLLDAIPVAIQTRILGLMVDEMTGLAIEISRTHLRLLVASRAVEASVAMRGVREVSDGGRYRALWRTARPRMTRSAIQGLGCPVVTLIAAGSRVERDATVLVYRGMTGRAIETGLQDMWFVTERRAAERPHLLLDADVALKTDVPAERRAEIDVRDRVREARVDRFANQDERRLQEFVRVSYVVRALAALHETDVGFGRLEQAVGRRTRANRCASQCLTCAGYDDGHF